uniref:Uncharacterized protein n=1 Tax=Panagrolaimus davidi TaxID=227884 RepID=A0A914PLN1_9BILA
MEFFVPILLVCSFSTVYSLQCHSLYNDTEPIVNCAESYCYALLVITGSGNDVSYSEAEGCETDIQESTLLKPFNITCKDEIQTKNFTVFGLPNEGILYCCKKDLCNTEIPGYPIPSTTQNPSTTKNPSTTENPTTTENPSTTTITK